MKFGQLILRKVIQIVATTCHILRLKMHQTRFRLGLRPKPRWGSLQRSPRPLAGFNGGLLLRGKEDRKGERGGKKGKVEGKREGGGKEGSGRGKGKGESGPLQGLSKMTPLVDPRKYECKRHIF